MMSRLDSYVQKLKNVSKIKNRPVHVSIGIGTVCVGVLAGLSYSSTQAYQINDPILIAFICLIILLLNIRLKIIALVFILLLSVCVGFIRGSIVHNSLVETADFAGKIITIQGTVGEDMHISVRGDYRTVLTDITILEERYTGSVWLSLAKDGYKRGDKIEVTGKASEGFSTYQLSMYKPTVQTIFRQNDPIIQFRDNFADAVRKYVVEPSASLGIGFVIGQKTALPIELEEQLRMVGLTHLVVASGYNLTILIRFAKRLFEKYSRFLVNASAISLVGSFVLISGASPSMVRASLVSGLSLLVWNYGRQFHPVLIILLVAAVTSFWQPLYIWADIGWWLSFLAFFGVLVLSPLIIKSIASIRKRTYSKPPAITQLLSETLAAQIVTLPIIMYVFGTVPLYSLIANMLTAPIIPFAMLATAFAGFTSMILPSISYIFSIPATILLSYFVAVVRILSDLPYALMDLSIPPYVMVLVYGLLILGCVVLWKKLKFNFRDHSVID